jgi:hypothetical protein
MKIGIWILFKIEKRKKTRVVPGVVSNVADDCDGDVLYDYMTEHGIVADLDDYNCDGDSESVAVVSKRAHLPDFAWEFRQFEVHE